jgi:N-acetyl-anhydromuramyl-L-alanine amidase AmpD
MTQVGFEHTTAVFERAKEVHALNRAATMIVSLHITMIKSRELIRKRQVAHVDEKKRAYKISVDIFKGRDHLGDLGVDERIIFNIFLKRIKMWGFPLASNDWGYGLIACSCE